MIPKRFTKADAWGVLTSSLKYHTISCPGSNRSIWSK